MNIGRRLQRIKESLSKWHADAMSDEISEHIWTIEEIVRLVN